MNGCNKQFHSDLSRIKSSILLFKQISNRFPRPNAESFFLKTPAKQLASNRPFLKVIRTGAVGKAARKAEAFFFSCFVLQKGNSVVAKHVGLTSNHSKVCKGEILAGEWSLGKCRLCRKRDITVMTEARIRLGVLVKAVSFPLADWKC